MQQVPQGMMARPRLYIVLTLAWLVAACSAHDHDALLVLEDLAAGDGPSRLKAASPQPQKIAISYQVEGRRYRGDVYVPAQPSLARIVLIPGALAGGKDDPRLVSFAMTLARIRFAVLVPDLAALRALQIGAEDVQNVRDAFAYFVSETTWAPHTPTGFGAFSYAVGPTILAALQPGIRDSVDFVLAVGGYHDLHQVITFFTTGYLDDAGTWRHLEPNAYGKWVFVHANLDRLSDPGDRETLRRMATRRMADRAAPISDLAEALGPEGQTLYQLLDNTDPLRTPELIARLPQSIRADIDALNLANKPLEQLRARLILVHGRDDNIIPYSESAALARRVPADRVALYIVDELTHVDVQPGLLQSWRLWRAVKALLHSRQAPS